MVLYYASRIVRVLLYVICASICVAAAFSNSVSACFVETVAATFTDNVLSHFAIAADAAKLQAFHSYKKVNDACKILFVSTVVELAKNNMIMFDCNVPK
ncbi:hypothetical protein FRX31_029613 [Thalictrum thalictroides]|uniref:Uncharacterized protein n=1 Tax=Thalictrum thalictroides TaxID=46969 RepID=A0A7J6V9A3_THATH|nr:hypothetical protein FRX31_029613 [Thalictrum thalictroides]